MISGYIFGCQFFPEWGQTILEEERTDFSPYPEYTMNDSLELRKVRSEFRISIFMIAEVKHVLP